MPRKSKKKQAQELFLAAYEATGSISRAFDVAREKAEEAGLDLPLHRQRHYEWIGEDQEYRTAFFAADETATQILEGEAFRRAFEGVEDFKLDRDGEPHYLRRYSDTLLMFLLKARRPDTYRERFDHRMTGSRGGPIGVAVSKADAQEGEDDPDDAYFAEAWEHLTDAIQTPTAGDASPGEGDPEETGTG